MSASGAELRGEVNPEGLQVSRCEFEWGTSTAYGESEPCEQKKSAIGSGTEPVPVSARITGLSSGTEYHWRLSVGDKDGEAFEPGHTFVYEISGSQLPDHRAYEMVTPPAKDGASIGDVFGDAQTSIAASGSRVITSSIQCFAGAESCTGLRGNTTGEPFLFTRTPTGWATTPLAPPAARFSENSELVFSAEDTSALFSTPSGPAGEEELYTREPTGTFTDIGPLNPPAVTGTKGLIAFTATGDLSHVLWEAEAPQLWPFDMTERRPLVISLYEYLATGNHEPFLVAVQGAQHSTSLISTCGAKLGMGTARTTSMRSPRMVALSTSPFV